LIQNVLLAGNVNMTDGSTGKKRMKARRTPSSPYPINPPEVNSSIEVIYYALNQSLIDESSSAFADRIVTSQILYQPGLLATARITFELSRTDIFQERDVAKIIPFPPGTTIPDWERNLVEKWDNANIRLGVEGICFYAVHNLFDFSPEHFDALKEDFIQFLISSEVLELYFNPYAKLYRKPDEAEENFIERCLEKLREENEQEIRNLEETILRQEDRFKERLERERESISELQSNEAVAVASTPTNHHAEMEAQESRMTIDEINRQFKEWKALKEDKMKEFNENLNQMARRQEKDIFRVNRPDIRILRMSLVWLPYIEFVVQSQERRSVVLVKSF
jgi:hypothetical protein